MTTTTIHVHNNVDKKTSNQVLLFLQPVAVSDNYLFSAWQVLNPGLHSWQICDLSTSISASVAAFASTRGDYTDPVGLTYGEPLLVTNQDEQGPTIGGTSSHSITQNEVGLDNECVTPPTYLSVTWYVNGNKVVETNNTDSTTLNPGFDSTFQLKQSVWLMFGQKPVSTQTYTVQTFSETTEIPVPNGASDLYIEAYTKNGKDTFKAVTKGEFEALTKKKKQESSKLEHGAPPSTILIGSLEQDVGDVLVIVTATFISALTVAAATYLLNNLLMKFSGGLQPDSIEWQVAGTTLKMTFKKTRAVLAILGPDKYKDAVDSALTKAVADPNFGLKGETYTLAEPTLSVLY